MCVCCQQDGSLGATWSMEETVNSVDSSETGAFLFTGGVLYARAHLETAWQLPIGVGAQFFITSLTPRPSQPSKCFHSMALHLPTPSYHHTSWGPLCCCWTTSTAVVAMASSRPGAPKRPFLWPEHPAALASGLSGMGLAIPPHFDSLSASKNRTLGCCLGPALRPS